MEFIIALVVVFIVYKLFFSSGAKNRTKDAIVGAAVKLGVPASEAQRILNTHTDELSGLLALSILPESTVKNLQAHERMAYCVFIIYKRG